MVSRCASRSKSRSRSRIRSSTPLKYSSRDYKSTHRNGRWIDDRSENYGLSRSSHLSRSGQLRKYKTVARPYSGKKSLSASSDSGSDSSSSGNHGSRKRRKLRRFCSRSMSPPKVETISERNGTHQSSEKIETSEIHTRKILRRKEDLMWASRRDERAKISKCGVFDMWSQSPSIEEIRDVYEEYTRMIEDSTIEFLGTASNIDDDIIKQKLANDVKEKESLKKKDNQKKSNERKHKKKEKKLKISEEKDVAAESSSDYDEWIEVTAEMREAEKAKVKLEEAAMIGPAIPEHLLENESASVDKTKWISYGKDMLRGEGAAMAAYVAQGKRIPRRGEIGLSSVEITDFEKIGYVMSGTRHKSMEATRLRKENQVMTAEEKRLLSGFTHEERKKKEDIVLQQFKSFIDSKRNK